jgi:hypothetical protein
MFVEFMCSCLIFEWCTMIKMTTSYVDFFECWLKMWVYEKWVKIMSSSVVMMFKVLLISISMVNDVCVFLGHNKCLYVKISDYLVIFHSNSKITRRSAPDTEWAAPSAIHKKSHESILVPAPITISIQSIVLTVDFGDRWLLTFCWLMHPEPISLQFFA